MVYFARCSATNRAPQLLLLHSYLNPNISTGPGLGGQEQPNVTPCFVETFEVGVCRGPYTQELVRAWHKWDKAHGSENDPVDGLQVGGALHSIDTIVWIHICAPAYVYALADMCVCVRCDACVLGTWHSIMHGTGTRVLAPACVHQPKITAACTAGASI